LYYDTHFCKYDPTTNVTLAADRSEYELVYAQGSVSFIHNYYVYRLLLRILYTCISIVYFHFII